MAVIFIHGLTGSNATWLNDESGSYFPDLLFRDEDPELKGKIDVYSVEYASLWNSGTSVVEVAKQVSFQIDRLIFEKKYTRVVFIAHSLGGNIAREYLVHVTTTFGHAALGRVRMLITLGTPVQGAKLANYASLFSGNEQLRSLIEIQKNDFLQFLRETSSNVLTKRLNNRCSLIEFDAGYETKPTKFVMIVPKESATALATRTAGEDWDKNHLQLPKPADRSDKVYKWATSELKLCAAGTDRCKEPLDPDATCSVGDFFKPITPSPSPSNEAPMLKRSLSFLLLALLTTQPARAEMPDSCDARENCKWLIAQPDVNKRLSEMLEETVNANKGKSKEEVTAIFEQRKKVYGAELKRRANESVPKTCTPA